MDARLTSVMLVPETLELTANDTQSAPRSSDDVLMAGQDGVPERSSQLHHVGRSCRTSARSPVGLAHIKRNVRDNFSKGPP